MKFEPNLFIMTILTMLIMSHSDCGIIYVKQNVTCMPLNVLSVFKREI